MVKPLICALYILINSNANKQLVNRENWTIH